MPLAGKKVEKSEASRRKSGTKERKERAFLDKQKQEFCIQLED
jgi:hypothetical protein